MKHIKFFSLAHATPEQLDTYENIEGDRPQILISEDGQDWYECQKLFSDETIKIMYDAQGVIRSMVTERIPERGNTLAVSMLFPVNCSVVEVNSIPDGCDISGAWLYLETGEIMRNSAFDLQQAENDLMQRMSEVNKTIAPLQDAVDLGMATEVEEVSLTAWRTFRVLLSRVDISTAPNVVWPEAPTV